MSGDYPVRAVMRAYGDVQRVGYRFAVQDLARKLGVKGYVKNLPDGSVEIVAEASKETVEKFADALKFREPPIDVARLDVVYGEATGEYEHFNLVPGDLREEIVEEFGTGLKYINLSREETKQGFKRVEETIKSTHEDLKGSIIEMHKDLKGGFEKVEDGIKEMHTDLKGSITAMHSDLKGGITALHGDMNRHFEEMAKRYDAISSELIRTREELTRAVDNMSRLIDEFIRRLGKRED